MKKLIIFPLIFILLIGNVEADVFATIGMTGLSFINPTAATVVRTALCVTGPTGLVTCAAQYVGGKVVGYVYGETIQEIAKLSPESAKAIITYNQIKGYIDAGATITKELKINENGEIEGGAMNLEGATGYLGKQLGFENEEDVYFENILLEINDEKGFTKITFKKNGKFWIKQNEMMNSFDNIKEGDRKTNAFIILDRNKNIIEADITSGDYGEYARVSYRFGDRLYRVPSNTRMVYKEGEVKVYGNKKRFGLEPVEGGIRRFYNIDIIEGDSVTITGNKIIGEGFEFNGDKISGLMANTFGEITISGDKIINVGKGTRAIVKGIQHETWQSSLNLYYDENFVPSVLLGPIYENYFNYGKNKINLGGSGFTSSLKEDNEIFPEYIGKLYEDSFAEREARLEFTPRAGSRLEITKVSEEGNPLALDIKSTGRFNLKNGRWNIESDGNNIYAKIEEEPQFPIAYDMRFNYLDYENQIKTYDLDIESSFIQPLSQQERDELRVSIVESENLIKKMREEYDILLENPKIREISDKWDSLNENIDKLIYGPNGLEYLDGQLDRAMRAGTPEQVKIIEKKMDQLLIREAELYGEKKLLREDPNYEILSNLRYDIEDIEMLMLQENRKLQVGLGEEKYGAFGEVISSKDGDAQITYSEFIEGFPVIKNTDLKGYYGEVYRPDLGYTVSGQRLETPRILRGNVDILDLIVDSKYQTCADTQIDLRAQYEFEELFLPGKTDTIKFKIANGETLEYKSDGTYSVWDPNQNKVVKKSYSRNVGENFDKWIENVQAYTNTGSLKDSLELVTELNDLKPGDLITLHPDPRTGYGHTQSIKEILEIPPKSGNIYYRLFAGSDPAIDPAIPSGLLSTEELIEDLQSGDAIILTWKKS